MSKRLKVYLGFCKRVPNIYIWCPPPKTYVFNKNSGIYSGSRKFWPVDLGSFFGGVTYLNHREETFKIQLTKLKNRKTEKLNDSGSLWKIQFFSFSVSPQIFRNSSVSKTEKQKN